MSKATFGRDRELAVLRRMVGDTAAGTGGVLVIDGSAGIGKTHLVEVVTALAHEAKLEVAARTAFSLDRAAPLVTLASALRNCQPATDTFTWLTDTQESQYRTLDRLREALEEFAAHRPMIISIDDAQWMDELSALAVRELVPALASSAVRWVFAHRPGSTNTPGQQVLSWLLRNGAERLSIRAIDEPAVARLCEQAVAAKVDNTVLALAGGCGGVPLQVEQLMTALRMNGQMVFSRGVATVTGDELPSSFITIVEQILNGLSEDAQRLVRTGSVFGRPFRISAVAGLLDRPPAQLVPLVEEATAARLLTHDDDALCFAHDLVRLAVYGTLNESVRALLHREAAMISRAERRPPVEVAEHLLKSGGEGAREAVTILHTAAREVSGLAPGTAADLIVHALDLIGVEDPERGTLIADAVRLLASAGRLEQAHNLGRTALRAGLDPATEGTLLLGLAEAFKHAGKNATAVDYADQALEITGIDHGLTAKLFAIRAHALFYVGDLREADRSGASAATAGEISGAFGATVFGLTARSLVAQAEGRLEESLAFAHQATRTADRVGGSAVHRHPRIWLGNALAAVDRFDDAERTYLRGREESERLGTAWSEPLWHYYQTALLAARGQIDDAITEADAGVAAAERLTTHQLAVPLLGALIRLSVVRGDPAQATDYRTHMRRLTATGITAAPEDVAWAEAVLLDETVGPEAAMDALAGIHDAMPERPALITQDPAAAAELVRIALRAQDRARAAVVVASARRLAEHNPAVLSLAAAAAHADGLFRADPERLRRAVDAFRRTPRVLGLAAALEDAANLAVAAGDVTTGRAYAGEALGIVTAAGARRAVPRLEALLGQRPVPSPAVDAGPACLRQLTEAERKVALLVAKGKRNREVADALFVSIHTVDSHLRKIFSKLGIASRVDLARLVAERQPTP
ncbi:AAA family ATPase [Dactylosporangium siamense]|uniref:LuxR family transcriptional regulator n=1 Tax=Dactylosporangium siamense TaxID=685454 RepID=A0A919PI32_9ACTN|nr:LuxR family transcriptional regulator [Dactylosporangium siamense]GIG42623.1 LuxR family transcriptional regulator [Dactylosporangium siamense]